MRRLAGVIAALLSAALLTLLPSPTQAAPAGAPGQQAIPALSQWMPASGSYTFTAASRIVVDPSFAAQLDDDAATFADDLRAQTGRTVPVVHGTAAAGDIRLSLGGSTPAEGYTMTVGSSIEIKASKDTGAFYATRTVLQLLRQSPTIAAGTATDAPAKPERGLMVDQGRKYFTVGWLRKHIKELAYLKLNTFHFHLSDNFGFRLESSTHPEIVSAQHYTKQEIRELVALAAKYHITIVPEIDFPGHMDAILAAKPELKLKSSGGVVRDSLIDLSKEASYTLISDLIKEYLPLFPGKYWHIGADEYIGHFGDSYSDYPQLHTYAKAKYGASAKPKDVYYGFINWANDIVRAGGKTMRMWNDGIRHDDGTINPAASIHVEYWYDYGLTPQQLLARGHTISNQSWNPTYYVLGGSKPDNKWGYETWHPNLFQAGGTIDQPARNLGSNVHVWADSPGAETEDQIAAGIKYTLRVIAQQTWGSPKPVPTYSEFTQLSDTIGRSPGWVRPIPGNLAYNRPVTASSTETPSFPAAQAVDGDPATRWSSAHTDPSSITVDLGSNVPISRVVLRWEAAYGKAYQIQTSTDGSTWTTRHSTTEGDGDVDDLTGLTGTGRYVRMNGTQRGTTYGYSLYEFEVYSPARSGQIKGVGSGRCLDIPASQTSTGTQLTIWDCHGDANQTWTPAADGTVRALGVCMTAAATTAGTPVTISPCTPSGTQLWAYETDTRRLRNTASGKCLDVSAEATANNSKLILYTCHTGANQQWTLPT
ncbi:family 20 glycosylhydrolase [Streptomyces sp. NPDC059010]|uniref:family 20 glycosylhydrolase n=1 Tax=Streptomyces sp. NPDC059010 TaxID=3346695 RepID=UPI0036A21442